MGSRLPPGARTAAKYPCLGWLGGRRGRRATVPGCTKSLGCMRRRIHARCSRLRPMRRTVFVLDLDGTLDDSVYQHVLAWQEALEAGGIELSVWRIHRRIGMSGGLFVGALLRETGQPVDAELVARLQQVHAEAYRRRATGLRLLPGARELLARLTEAKGPRGIAPSGLIEAARPTLELLGVPDDVPVVTRNQVARAKPDPDLFLAAAARLGA